MLQLFLLFFTSGVIYAAAVKIKEWPSFFSPTAQPSYFLLPTLTLPLKGTRFEILCLIAYRFQIKFPGHTPCSWASKATLPPINVSLFDGFLSYSSLYAYTEHHNIVLKGLFLMYKEIQV